MARSSEQRFAPRPPKGGRRARSGCAPPAPPKARHPANLTLPPAAPQRRVTPPAASMRGGSRPAPRESVAELARHLAQHAEAVCRHYLSNGRRRGAYWQVGDVANTPGQSLYVHLGGSRAGKWCDAATGEHGDLLDLIGLTCHCPTLKGAIAEARGFLDRPGERPRPPPEPATSDKTRGAQRLFAMAHTITGTLAERYLTHRGIVLDRPALALRFHPRCIYRDEPSSSPEARPALLAAVTDLTGRVTGIQRTWLDASGRDKAAVVTPCRALGRLSGNGVRFGQARDVLVVGEGIETVLSLKTVMPGLPMVAALSASQLASLVLPTSVERLYVARDRDAAGRTAFERLARRAHGLNVRVGALDPVGGDFNDDLVRCGTDAVFGAVARQLGTEDVRQGRAKGRDLASAIRGRAQHHDRPVQRPIKARSAGG